MLTPLIAKSVRHYMSVRQVRIQEYKFCTCYYKSYLYSWSSEFYSMCMSCRLIKPTSLRYITIYGSIIVYGVCNSNFLGKSKHACLYDLQITFNSEWKYNSCIQSLFSLHRQKKKLNNEYFNE